MPPPPGPDAARRRRPTDLRKAAPGTTPTGNKIGRTAKDKRGRGVVATRYALSDYLAESRAEGRERRRIERRIAEAQRGSGRLLAGLYLAAFVLLAAALLVAGWWMQRKSGGDENGKVEGDAADVASAVPVSKLVVKALTGAARSLLFGGGGGGSVASPLSAGLVASASASSLRTTNGPSRAMRIISAYPPGVARADLERLTQGVGWPKDEEKNGGRAMSHFVIPGWRAMVLEPRGLDRRVAASASREVKLRRALTLDVRGKMTLATWGLVQLEVLDSDDVREVMLGSDGKGRGSLAERCGKAAGFDDDPGMILRLFRGEIRVGADDSFRIEVWKWCSLLAGEADAYFDLAVKAEVPYGLGEALVGYRDHGQGIVAMTDAKAEGKSISPWAHPSFLVFPPPPLAALGEEGENSKSPRTHEVHSAARDVAGRAIRSLVRLNDSEIEELFGNNVMQQELGGRIADWFGLASNNAAAGDSNGRIWSRWTAECRERHQKKPSSVVEDEDDEDESGWLLKRCEEFVPRATCCYFYTPRPDVIVETVDGDKGLRG